MKGRTPTAAEKRHMDRVVQLGCVVCWLEQLGFTPAEIHHLEGKTKPDAHRKVLPLCFPHHRSGVKCDEYVSFHPWKSEFHSRYGTAEELLSAVDQMLERVA